MCPGLLFLFYCCVNMLFWRVFMRISYTCPEHLKFALTVEKWTQLVQLSSDAIDWLDAHERMYDVWLLVAYCATSCALVHVRPSASSVGTCALTGRCSSIHTRADRTKRRWRSSGSSATASADGKRRYRRNICPRGARSVCYLLGVCNGR